MISGQVILVVLDKFLKIISDTFIITLFSPTFISIVFVSFSLFLSNWPLFLVRDIKCPSLSVSFKSIDLKSNSVISEKYFLNWVKNLSV